MPRKTKKHRITERQKLFVEYLPENNWDFFKSALAAGYSKSYANARIHSIVKSNVGLCRLINEKRQEITAGSVDKRDKAERKLLEIAYNPSTRAQTAIKALDVVGKMNSWQSQTINLESKTRQAELDASHKQEIRELAMLRNRMSLPAGDVAVYDTIEQPDSLSGGDTDSIGDDIADVSLDSSEGQPDKDNRAAPRTLSDMVVYQEAIAPQADDGAVYPSIPQEFFGK
jgi:phage terminase small subunit